MRKKYTATIAASAAAAMRQVAILNRGMGGRHGARVLVVLIWAVFSATTRANPVEVRTLGASGEAAAGLCVRCVNGDYQVTNGKLDITIGASHRRDESFYKFPTADALGSIVFFRPAGTDVNGDIMLGTPYVRVDNTTRHIRYDKLEILRAEGHVTFMATGYYGDGYGARAQFVANILISPDSERVDITLTATNVGHKPLENFIYALFFDPHQMYDFSPSDIGAYRELRFRAYPRENHLIAWVDQTRRNPDDTDYSFGWDGGMILADPLAVNLAPGASDSRHYSLFTGASMRSVLTSAYKDVGVATVPAFLEFNSSSTGYFEIILRDATSPAIFFRSFLDSREPLAIELPAGNYVARANFFPGVAECSLVVTKGGLGRCVLRDPAQGRASVRIVNSTGDSVPGKISFNGISPTPSPYFRPVNPTRSNGYWESYKNSVFPVNAEQEIDLPVGSYLVSATAGPEFTLDQRTVRIAKDRTETLVLQVDRVIDRPDLVAIDPHLHTLESDGAVDVAQKIRALVASGVNVAVATDHNFPVDYRPALEKLGLRDRLSVLTGAEVTVPERLDYNTYPMLVRPDEYNHGAIDALSPDISSRFRLSRARDPGVILQVNHPRWWQFDYFNWFGLDPESAAFAYQGFDLDFDVLEVVNGAIYQTPENRAARRDWFNLLRRGYYFPLVGSSDSHEVDQDEPGFSRTYVYRGDTSGAPLSAEQLIRRVREGRSFASNGPILDLTAFDRYRPGDTVTVMDGIARIGIDVLTAPWIEAEKVQIYVNGLPQNVQAKFMPHPTARHLRATVELKLSSDAYVVGEVTGTKDLFPMLQRRSGSGGEETGVLPYALTNPIFIDVDGNGQFDPPLPHKIEIRARIPVEQDIP